MIKTFSILLSITILLSLAACSTRDIPPTDNISIYNTTSTTSKYTTGTPNGNNNQADEEIDTQIPIEQMILGEWVLVSQQYSNGQSSNWDLDRVKLYEDGTCAVNGEIGTWKLVEDELMILGTYGGRFWDSDAIVGEFSCDGDTLEFYGAQVDGNNNSVDLVYRKSYS